MKYLKLSSPHYLDHIDPETFSYPKATCTKGHDRYDNSDFIQAWSVTQYAPNSNGLYFQEYGDLEKNWPELRSEVDLWNSDPKSTGRKSLSGSMNFALLNWS